MNYSGGFEVHVWLMFIIQNKYGILDIICS